MKLSALRWTLWGLLGLVLLATAVGSWLGSPDRPEGGEPPPVLGELPPFQLVNRDGRTVSLDDLRGRVWVANFIFTRCALSCPKMTSQMLRLGEGLPDSLSIARVSFSVDPTYDTPDVLADYAASYSIVDPQWLFLTGEPDAVERLTVEGFKLPIVRDAPPEIADPREPILHSDRMVLVDRVGRIRGYYEVDTPGGYEKLVDDIVEVSEEDTVMPSAAAPVSSCAREIEELHAFFGDWYLAELPATDEVLERLAGVLAEDFLLIGPDGQAATRRETLDGIRAAHGSRQTSGFEIWIDEIHPRPTPGGHCLMTYREWQRTGESTRVRLSTVLFRARPGTPNGVEWLHLHETWLPVEEEG